MRLSTTAKDMLANVDDANAVGHSPNKAEVVTLGATQIPSQTRAGRYRIIDRLLREGYLANVAIRHGEYALRITEAGRAAIYA